MNKLMQFRKALCKPLLVSAFGHQRYGPLPNARFCTNDNGPRNQNTNFESKIEPVSLSYTSYESPKADPTAAPIIIMHGERLIAIFPFFHSLTATVFFVGLFGSKQNWRSISKALHAKSSPTRKVRIVYLYVDNSEKFSLFNQISI